MTSFLADRRYCSPAVFTSTPVAVLFGPNSTFSANVLVYTLISVLCMAEVRKLVSEEDRRDFFGSMVLGFHAEPITVPLLKFSGCGRIPTTASAFCIHVACSGLRH